MFFDTLLDILAFFVEVVFSLLLFLSPVLASGLILIMVYGKSDISWVPIAGFLGAGALLGIFINYKVWKREKPSTFFGRLIGNSADLREEDQTSTTED